VGIIVDKIEYEKMYKMEESYWWFAGKRYLVESFIRKYYKQKNKLNILDVGCGTGIIMSTLSKYGKVYGIDASELAVKFCQKRKLKNVKKAFVQNLPFKDNQFDIVTCLDLLYHKAIKDDLKAMKEINRVIKKGGRLVLTDSAMMCLYGAHDLAHHGIRRYSKEELKEKLLKSGFKIEKISYYNTALFPFVLIKRKIEKFLKPKKSKSDVQDINPIINWILKKLFKFEFFFLKFIDYPFGV